MGITLGMINSLQKIGLFGEGKVSILDIGSSNLYSAHKSDVIDFLKCFGVEIDAEIQTFADTISEKSEYDERKGGRNDVFVGELFEKAGFRYESVDIAEGYHTTILDLNHDTIPDRFIGAFDLVLNYGTTEHLLNQYNAFKVMHDSTRLGGYIVNSLPCVGYSDHGYLNYNPRCMFDLAGYNEYELVRFWFDGPGRNNDLLEPLRNYKHYFKSLERDFDEICNSKIGEEIGKQKIKDIGLFVIYKKIKDLPFMGAIERSTSVGKISEKVVSGYESSMPKNKPYYSKACLNITDHRHQEIELSGKADKLRKRFVANKLSLKECLSFYHLVLDAHGSFPLDWEYKILLLAIEKEPERKDLIERIEFVRQALS